MALPAGPWHFAQPWSGHSVLKDRDGKTIFGIYASQLPDERRPSDELEAARHAIEATFDLLAAGQALIAARSEPDFPSQNLAWCRAVQKLEAAIKRATGE